MSGPHNLRRREIFVNLEPAFVQALERGDYDAHLPGLSGDSLEPLRLAVPGHPISLPREQAEAVRQCCEDVADLLVRHGATEQQRRDGEAFERVARTIAQALSRSARNA